MPSTAMTLRDLTPVPVLMVISWPLTKSSVMVMHAALCSQHVCVRCSRSTHSSEKLSKEHNFQIIYHGHTRASLIANIHQHQ